MTSPEQPRDDAAWDAFVAASGTGSYSQLSGWARVKGATGWQLVPVDVRDGDDRIGARVLIRRPRSFPWGFAYAPRGPVATAWTPATIERFTAEATRVLRKSGRVSHLRIDPEIEVDGPHDPGGASREALRGAGWRPGQAIAPRSTRLIDLRADEAALWGDLRKKWRQYVNRAQKAGIRVVDGGRDRLPEFYSIYEDTASRAGFPIRTEASYRDVWDAFEPAGLVRLLFAETPEGEAQATLFLVRTGTRVVEPYGGMTEAGAESRANYLLKWEAIRRSREEGAETYDMWGLGTSGIAWFKTGFGGREVRYIGPWDLVLDPVGRVAYESAIRARTAWKRLRRGGGGDAAGYTAATE